MKTSFFLITVSVSCLVGLAGCSRRPTDPSAALAGKYQLSWGTGSYCSEHGVESSTLELRSDGTSEQRDRFKDGSLFVTAGRWQYVADDHVGIDKLRATNTLEIDKNASATYASLIVQWSKPPNILLNPHDSCVFAKAP
jgi:hypothetical protein